MVLTFLLFPYYLGGRGPETDDDVVGEEAEERPQPHEEHLVGSDEAVAEVLKHEGDDSQQQQRQV